MDRWHPKALRNDAEGFSTTFDVLLFLVMVSICSIILLPAITGNTQIKSVIGSKNQEQSSDLLLTLLNGRVDEFEYFVGGEQMDTIAGQVNRSPVYLEAKKLIAGKEIRHKTFADIAAEDAASQWVVYHNGKRMQLNFLMSDYTNRLKSEMKDYLEEQIGDRYNYNFTVVWMPFANSPFGSDISIGEPVPDNAYVESTFITMPYHVNFTRKRIEGIIDSSFNTSSGNISAVFDKIKRNDTDRAMIEDGINQAIFDSMNSTIDDAVSDLVDDKIGPILDDGQDKVITQMSNFLPGNEEGIDFIASFNESILFALNKEGAVTKEKISGTLKSYLQEISKQETHELAENEIKALVTDLVDMYVDGAMTIDEVKDRMLTDMFSRISISRAQATLSIWEKRI